MFRQPKLSILFLLKYQLLKMGCGCLLKENTDSPMDLSELEPDQEASEEYFWTLVNHYDKLNNEARRHLSLHFLMKVGQKVKPDMSYKIDTNNLGMHILQPQKMNSRNSTFGDHNSLEPSPIKESMMVELPDRSQSATKRQVSMIESMVELNEIANDVAIDGNDKEVKASGESNYHKPSGANTTMTKLDEENEL